MFRFFSMIMSIIDCDTGKVRTADENKKNGSTSMTGKLRLYIQDWWYELDRNYKRQQGGFVICAIIVSSDGKSLASVSSPVHYERQMWRSHTGGFLLNDRKVLFLWDLHQQKIKSVWRFSDSYNSLHLPQQSKMSLAFSLNEQRIITFGDRINVFGKAPGSQVLHRFSHTEWVNAVALTQDCRTGVTGSLDGTKSLLARSF
jgi:WD40 repeat protein